MTLLAPRCALARAGPDHPRLRRIRITLILLGALGCSTEPHLPVLQGETEAFVLYAPTAQQGVEAAETLAAAAARFRELFGVTPPRIAVLLFDDMDHMGEYDLTAVADQGLLALVWLTATGARRLPEADALPAPRRSGVLAHEACHLYLIAHVSALLGYDDPHERGEALGTPGTAGYGDPLLPDWLDEAVAVLCEPEAMRAERRALMRAGVDDRIPLATFFTMDHPSLGDATARADPDRRAPAGTELRVTIREVDPGERDLFYPQALSVAEFLIHRAGPRIIGRMVGTYARGGSLEEALLDERQLPDSVEGLESEWVQWVSTTT